MNFTSNRTMEEAARIEGISGWKKIGLCYLLYIIIMQAGITICNNFGFDEISGVLISYTIAALVCVGYMLTFGKRTPLSLGMSKEGAGSRILGGWLIAIISLGIIWVINLLSGAVKSGFNKNFSPLVFLLLLIGFIFQGFMEEFLMRALLQTQFSIKFGVIWAILINSVIFGIGHIRNEGASVISTINTVLIGIVFSIIFYYHDSLWVAAGFHSGWNFILGPVLGISVSGFTLPTKLMDTAINSGMQAVNGGAYGFEASFPVTVLSLAIIAVYLVLIARENRQTRISSVAQNNDVN